MEMNVEQVSTMPRRRWTYLPQVPAWMIKEAQRIMSESTFDKRCAGKIAWQKWVAGEDLTTYDRIQAHCWLCQGYYRAGFKDCKNQMCPLYPEHMYNPMNQAQVPGKKGIV